MIDRISWDAFVAPGRNVKAGNLASTCRLLGESRNPRSIPGAPIETPPLRIWPVLPFPLASAYRLGVSWDRNSR